MAISAREHVEHLAALDGAALADVGGIPEGAEGVYIARIGWRRAVRDAGLTPEEAADLEPVYRSVLARVAGTGPQS